MAVIAPLGLGWPFRSKKPGVRCYREALWDTCNPENYPAIKDLAESQRSIDKWYVSYSDSNTESELAEIIDFSFIGGGVGRMTRRDILLHVVNHTTYHRGHAANILYHLGISPPTTDLPVFLREQSHHI